MIQKGSLILDNRTSTLIEVLLGAALEAVDACKAVKQAIVLESNNLQIGDQRIILTPETRLRLIAIGKAALPMAAGALEKIGGRFSDGLVVTKSIDAGLSLSFPSKFRILSGGHPIPTKESIECGLELMRFLERGDEKDVILTLISGGASALVQVPMGKINLCELQELTKILQNCGATIEELNTVRKHLDLVKGGGLIRAAKATKVVNLFISDVKDDRIDLIASGMTLEDPSTTEDAMGVLRKYCVISRIPLAVLDALQSAAPPKFSDQKRKPFSTNTILLNNLSAVEGVLWKAQEFGWYAESLGWILYGEAKEKGKDLSDMLSRVALEPKESKPICLVGGGETTVHVVGQGIGGRNLETALAAVEGISGSERVALITFATDGEDAQTSYAGAVVTEKTKQIASEQGLSANVFLEDNDSCNFFQSTGGLIQTGSTGTNVNDLVIMLAW